jgi:hypothetical protein
MDTQLATNLSLKNDSYKSMPCTVNYIYFTIVHDPNIANGEIWSPHDLTSFCPLNVPLEVHFIEHPFHFRINQRKLIDCCLLMSYNFVSSAL